MRQVFDATAFPEVVEILRLMEEAKRVREADLKAGKWLNAAMASDNLRTAVDKFLAEYGGARAFVVILGKYLVEQKLITPVAERVTIEPDFLDILQERIV
jgi:hypothetical protein